MWGTLSLVFSFPHIIILSSRTSFTGEWSLWPLVLNSLAFLGDFLGLLVEPLVGRWLTVK